ncbi:hypothetical protein M413DRAFT_129425 [Hebeloma cylindrosporum]|uniref:Uncharacterized protein n=1 Tax=Hebeloma cylindrosporum TaxID=76867 RepID=A0A0C2YMJ1_HEBCY|nr:hypothetical protein M413DRAFT_129425 [Hebeloma cylindrosporum h7]
MQDGPQASQPKRRPLPPQTHTYMTSSTTGPIYRDPPPHSIPTLPGRDTDNRGRIPDNSNAPRRPRRGSVSPPRAENRGAFRQHDTRRSSNIPPQAPPAIDTRMDVDPEHLERSSYIPSPSMLRGSRPQVDERLEPPEGPRSARPLPPKQVSPIVPMGFHPGGPSSSEYTNFGSQSRPLQPPPPHGPSRYDQKSDGYIARDQGQSERRPMAHGERGGPLPRRDVRTRPEGSTRQPPPPIRISGTNNIPIGVRRGPGPPSNPPASFPSDGPLNSQHTVFNPDARPPASTLINPGREPLPAKASYERVCFYQASARRHI